MLDAALFNLGSAQPPDAVPRPYVSASCWRRGRPIPAVGLDTPVLRLQPALRTLAATAKSDAWRTYKLRTLPTLGLATSLTQHPVANAEMILLRRDQHPVSCHCQTMLHVTAWTILS